MTALAHHHHSRASARNGKLCIGSVIMTEERQRERQGMPSTPTQRPSRMDLLSSLGDFALTDLAADKPSAFRVFAGCLKLSDSWATLYHSVADIARALKLHRAHVGKHIDALVQAGWMEVVAAAPGKAARYVLRGPNDSQNLHSVQDEAPTAAPSPVYVM